MAEEKEKNSAEVQAYLARIRKTIADSEQLVSQTQLRIAETDRMLEKQGLTRDQVMAMRFTDAQFDAVNAELKRRGMEPLEKWEPEHDRVQEELDSSYASHLEPGGMSADSELAERQRKFGMMMKPFQI